MPRMENRSRLVVIALVAVLAVLGGFAAGAFLTGNRASPTEAPTAIAEPTDEPSASATPVPAPTAAITFTSLALDAADNPDGQDRVLTWNSATGGVKAEISSVTPMGDVEMCLSTPDKKLGCRTAGSGTL